MTEKLTGGCACGHIRYSVDGAPRYMGNCHCRDCQQATGSAYFPGVGVKTENFTLESGEPAWYERAGDSGNVIARAFCPKCGSPVFLQGKERPHFRVLYAGSLDDPSVFQPAQNIFMKSAQHWAWPDKDMPGHDAMPG